MTENKLKISAAEQSGAVLASIEDVFLSGPSGFSIRIIELQHTFQIAFEPGRLAAPLVKTLVGSIFDSRDSIESFVARARSREFTTSIRINGREFSEFEEPIPLDRDRQRGLIDLRLDFEVKGTHSGLAARSGALLTPEGLAATQLLADFILQLLDPDPTDYDDSIGEPLTEGAGMTIIVNRYERDPKVRKSCIDHFGAKCLVCELDLGKRYGEIGVGFIEVHHIVPLSDGEGAEREIDPTRDVVPLCPNCHAMVHRGGVTRDLETIREALHRNL